VDINLDTLKREMLDYLQSAGFAVFHSSPGTLEGLPMVLWDTERYPDFQMFLDVAQKVGAKVILFASRDFEPDELDELASQIGECGLDRDEQREYESRIRNLRAYEGQTCTLELAFDYDSRFYVYELQPDWFEEFLSMEDDVASRLVDEDDDDSLGGYFSKN
jgi:hypothetical protein